MVLTVNKMQWVDKLKKIKNANRVHAANPQTLRHLILAAKYRPRAFTHSLSLSLGWVDFEEGLIDCNLGFKKWKEIRLRW